MGQPAARITDAHVCAMSDGPKPHVGGPVSGPCAVNVIVGGQPQARIGDICVCASVPDALAMGSPTVIVCGMPASRITDLTVHGGTMVIGMPNVLIGETGGMAAPPSIGMVTIPLALEGKAAQAKSVIDTMMAAAEQGAPFCEQCIKF